MHRITSYADEELAVFEQQADDAMAAALQRVMDQIADRVLKHARTVVYAATAPPPDQPEPVPGQPYVSPDDLSSITPLWRAEVQQMLPLIAQIYQGSAGQIHAGLAAVVDLPALDQAASAAATAYLQRVQNVYEDIGSDLWETARGQLVDGFKNGESIDQLADRLRSSAGMTARRATLVARSTVIESSNAGSINTAKASGLEMLKEWIATADARTRPSHRIADGQRVDLHDTFTVGGFSADVPGDPLLPAAEKYNCRCTIGYVMGERQAAAGQAAAQDQEAQQTLPGTEPDTEQMARDRLAEIEQARGYAELASVADEQIANQASARAFAHRLRSQVVSGNLPHGTADELIAAHGDSAQLDLAIERLATQHGLVRNTARAGETARLDRATMDVIGPTPDSGLVLVVRPGYSATIRGEPVQVFKATVQEASEQEAAAFRAAQGQSVAETIATERRARREAARARNREIEAAKPYAQLSGDVDEIVENHHGIWSHTLDTQLRQAGFMARQQGVPQDELIQFFDTIGNEAADPVRTEAFRVAANHGVRPMHRIGDRVAYDPKTMEPIGETAYDVGQIVQVTRRGQQLTLADGSSLTLDKAIVRAAGQVPASGRRSAMDIIKDWDSVQGRGGKAARTALERELGEGFEGTFGGLTTRVTAVDMSGASALVSGEIVDANGVVVGDFSRSFYRATKTRKPRVNHNTLHLEDDVQGSGFATEFNHHAFEWYRASGIDRVTTLANVDVGGYTWAAQGFDFVDKSEAASWAKRMRSKLVGGKLGGGVASDVDALAAKLGLSRAEAQADLDEFMGLLAQVDRGVPVSAYRFSQVGRRPGQGGKTSLWMGKLAMLDRGTAWYGVFPL